MNFKNKTFVTAINECCNVYINYYLFQNILKIFNGKPLGCFKLEEIAGQLIL